MKIILDNRQDDKEISEVLLKKIEKVIVACLEHEDYSDDYEVSLSFVKNDEIKDLNRDFRNIDKVTDVLSFPMLSDEDFDIEYEEYSLGDIVISVDRAEQQAIEYGHSFEREICFLVCHSMFHLLGYDHMQEDEAEEMHAKENYVLDSLGITRGQKYEQERR